MNGDFDPTISRTNAKGQITMIRIAKGLRGEEALPEEFAHLILATMRANGNPLFNRLYNFVSSREGIISQVLGENYQSYLDNPNYRGEDGRHKLIMEVMGKMVTAHVLNNEEARPE